MTKNRWLLVAILAAAVFVVAAINLFADNKAEIIVMAISGMVAFFAAHASGRSKVKELG
jgi:hypothetical protein